jgi:hypothetical protein
VDKVEQTAGGVAVHERFGVRIISPADIAHSFETHTYPSEPEAYAGVQQIVEKFRRLALEAWEIHVIDRSTGQPVTTTRRHVERKVIDETY